MTESYKKFCVWSQWRNKSCLNQNYSSAARVQWALCAWHWGPGQLSPSWGRVQVSHKGVQNQFPSFISALCGNCDTRPVGILTGSKSHQRLTFCLVYLKRSSRSSGRRRFLQKTCIFHYVVSGEGGKMRLPICRHCNLWWVMGNINEKCDPRRQGSANFIPT